MKSAIITLERCGFFANFYIPIKKQLRKSGSRYAFKMHLKAMQACLTQYKTTFQSSRLLTRLLNSPIDQVRYALLLKHFNDERL